MSVNFTQKPDYNQQQGNFGGTMTEAPPQYGILKSMGLPSNWKETKEWSPYFITALGLSKLISDSAVFATRVNPLKNPKITVAESYNKSFIGKLTAKIDNFLLPKLKKHSGKINSFKSAVSKHTPDWVKNALEKIKTGVSPKNPMALGQYRGCTLMASNEVLNKIREIPPSEWAKLGIKDMSAILKGANGKASKKAVLRTIQQISDRLAKVSAKDLQNLTLSNGKAAKILNDLNKAKAFMGVGSKTAVSKYIKKGAMYASEALGGGVLGGGNLFGLAMNSIFFASTLKRTWNAEWGDKFSTFMEGVLVEFGGIYLTMLLGTRLTYKLLGLKNIDKTATQIRSIKGLTQGINTMKGRYTEALKLQKLIKEGQAAEGMFAKLIRKFKGLSFEESVMLRTQNLLGGIGKYKKLGKGGVNVALNDIATNYPKLVNKSIDKLAKMRKFQANGNGFIRNLFNRPIRWIGNFFSIGLENLPTRIGKTGLGRIGTGWHKFRNGFKWAAGYPLRFALVAMIVTPPLTNLLAKISHTFFGKPKHSCMDEGKAEAKAPAESTKQEPQMDKMQAFSEITKQLGAMRAAAQPTALPPNYNPQISQGLVARAVNDQRTRISQGIKPIQNISPATYVPTPVGSRLSDADVQNEYQLKLAKCDNIERYANSEIAALKSIKDPYKY